MLLVFYLFWRIVKGCWHFKVDKIVCDFEIWGICVIFLLLFIKNVRKIGALDMWRIDIALKVVKRNYDTRQVVSCFFVQSFSHNSVYYLSWNFMDRWCWISYNLIILIMKVIIFCKFYLLPRGLNNLFCSHSIENAITT